VPGHGGCSGRYRLGASSGQLAGKAGFGPEAAIDGANEQAGASLPLKLRQGRFPIVKLWL
jgi:hypothetical protein